ncbi:hypothetical protein [endosymbiont GvMRE of Glomus versiforme]|uniref:hypothetical protein n=1 Tax=endosymbiont GvMRE of Glomus versiforme TaxID=2039283 RepID=UPI000EE9C927|nr:hypothetical protein [endosymbiont GvMRE of Glomus versiforme]RHZ37726.1 hypothetical protein GvMRE_I1g358 [endosymbiont GvMRE of Glomus versiforme]
MTKYNFEEFKQWLEEKPERQDGLRWTDVFPLIKNRFDAFVEGKDDFAEKGWIYTQTVAQKWKQEVDQRERERERAKGGRGKYV